MPDLIRLFIADDHAIMREGLRQLFALTTDLEVAGEAENGAQLLDRLHPGHVDLLLLDMNMPGISGEALVARVHALHPTLPILVLSMHNETQVAQRALRAGALGYLSKDRDPETLLAAIRRVSAGERFIDPRLAEQMALEASGFGSRRHHDCLTDRELQILRLIAHGLSVNDIAAELAISNKTVSTHKARMMDKMAFASNADIVRYAIAQQLID